MFEAIVNAICHRDYTSNASVQVMLFPDRLEVMNPGPLPKGMTVAKLKRRHKSMPVNPLLARGMYLRGYIEHVGSGTGDIIEKCKAKGLPDPLWENEDDGFTVTIKRAAASQMSQRALQETTRETTLAGEHVREHVREHVCVQVERIVAACDREMSERELREAVGVRNRPNFTTRYLTRALAGGYLERTSTGTRSPLQKYRLTEKGRNLVVQTGKKSNLSKRR